MKIGDRVWYRPQTIGYGYLYGLDEGIPATVLKIGDWDEPPRRAQIRFRTKSGDDVPPRWVAMKNLEPRRETESPT